MKTISISLYNRPQYTKIVLQALKTCPGIDKYKTFVSIDPGNKEVISIAENFNPDVLVINPKRLGCNTNIFQAISLAFANGSEYNIHIEDDVLVAQDCIQYFDWCQQYKDDKSIFSIAAYHWCDKEMPPHLIARAQTFHCWGWAIWRNRWEEIKDQWDFTYKYAGWDNNINNRLRGNRYQIYPLLSRSQNIGALNGTHVTSPEWHAKHHHTPVWNISYMIDQFEMLKEEKDKL